ncbi:MAG: FadR family transcriptional regulator [Rhodobacter sp.]|nr:FadR family transcriptional regulator [Rhodobacter sp.]
MRNPNSELVVHEMRSRRGHMVTDLADKLRRQISGGEYVPGDRLPSEAELCKTHGVSRTVVREAIASLRADDLVEPRQGSGVYVLQPKPVVTAPFSDVDYDRISSVVELLELRMAVEAEAAALAAARRSPAQEEQIVHALRAFVLQVREHLPTSEADFALHLAIAEASNNSRIVEFLRLLGVNSIPRQALRPSGTGQKVDDAYLTLIIGEHEKIVDAILDGSPGEARQKMRTHLEGSLSRYRKLLRSSGAEGA